MGGKIEVKECAINVCIYAANMSIELCNEHEANSKEGLVIDIQACNCALPAQKP